MQGRCKSARLIIAAGRPYAAPMVHCRGKLKRNQTPPLQRP